MDLGSTVKVPSDIVKGGTTAIKQSTEKAKGWQEPAKIAVSGILGFPVEIGLEYLSNMITNALGAQNNLIRLGIKLGTPLAIGTVFIAGKLPFGKLVAAACITAMIVAVGREILKLVMPQKDTNGITKYDVNQMSTTPTTTKWGKLIS